MKLRGDPHTCAYHASPRPEVGEYGMHRPRSAPPLLLGYELSAVAGSDYWLLAGFVIGALLGVGVVGLLWLTFERRGPL